MILKFANAINIIHRNVKNSLVFNQPLCFSIIFFVVFIILIRSALIVQRFFTREIYFNVKLCFLRFNFFKRPLFLIPFYGKTYLLWKS